MTAIEIKPAQLLTLFLFFIFQMAFGQECGCKNIPELEEVISCEKTVFKNGAQIYRQYNCDSSWVVFESKNKKKKTLFSLEGELMGYTGRLGFADWEEYKKSFLVESRPISGCCDPSEYILFDKNNGTKIADLGTQIFHHGDINFPFFVSIDPQTANSLIFLNLETSKTFKIDLPEGRIEKTMQVSSELFSEALFEEGKIENGVFEIVYRYKTTEEEDWQNAKITVDLKNK